MNLFLNDKPVRLIRYDKNESYKQYFDSVLIHKDEIISKKLTGRVLIDDATPRQFERLLRLMEIKKLKKLESVTLAVRDISFYKEFIKDQFKVIKASGGLVKKEEMFLLIYRMNKWDLPKGKLKKKEDSAEGARREVEEECNVRVIVHEKLCSTWHSYIRKGKRILKKTEWFVMSCVDDSEMGPQVEELIEDVRWFDKKDVKKVLKSSYRSIEEVFNIYAEKVSV